MKPRTCHYLKIWPGYFEEVLNGNKTFEVRRNDRDFSVEDVLILQEYNVIGGYSGRQVFKEVSYILSDSEFVKDGYVIMGLIERTEKP